MHLMSAVWFLNQEARPGLLMCHRCRSPGLQDLSGNVELQELGPGDLQVLFMLMFLRTLVLPKPCPLHRYFRNPEAVVYDNVLPNLQIYRTFCSG